MYQPKCTFMYCSWYCSCHDYSFFVSLASACDFFAYSGAPTFKDQSLHRIHAVCLQVCRSWGMDPQNWCFKIFLWLCFACFVLFVIHFGIFCWKSFQAVISWFCVSQCINLSTRTRLVVGNLKVSVVKKFGPFTERLMSSPETLGQTAELIKIWLWIINWSKVTISSTCLAISSIWEFQAVDKTLQPTGPRGVWKKEQL